MFASSDPNSNPGHNVFCLTLVNSTLNSKGDIESLVAQTGQADH